MATLSRDDIVGALERLGQLAAEQGLSVELTLMGGAVMVLAYQARLSTRDVDVVIVAPRGAENRVRQLAAQVAAERGWPEDWLNDMATIEQLAEAALQRDSLRLRSLTQDLLRETPRLSDVPRPASADPRVLSTAAALVELLAARQKQNPPAWAREVGPLPLREGEAFAQQRLVVSRCR